MENYQIGLEEEKDVKYYIDEKLKTEKENYEIKDVIVEISTELSEEKTIMELINLFSKFPELNEWLEEAEANGFYEDMEINSVRDDLRRILSLALYNYLTYYGNMYYKEKMK